MTRPVTSMPRCSPTLCRSWCTTGRRFHHATRPRSGTTAGAGPPVPGPAGTTVSATMSVPHPRVDERRDDVDEEVRDRDDHGHEHDDPLHGDEVARLEVLGELEAEPLPLERRLGEHGAREKHRDLETDDGDDGDERGAPR